jgi:DNA adenine methylase
MLPAHLHFVEPFAGGCAVLLSKPCEGISEVVNDLNGRLVNFWRVLRDEQTFQRFRRQVEATPFAREEWQIARSYDPADGVDAVADAVAFFVAVRQSLAGRGKNFAPLSKARTRRGMNEQASAWLTAVEGLPAVHARLKRVVIENLPALDLIHQEDRPETLFYCDPPYLKCTRTAPDAYGNFEMSDADHRDLLDALAGIQGKFLLSGYRSDMYDRAADRNGWRRVYFDLPNNAAGGKSKRRMTECIWCNFAQGEGANRDE